MRSTWITWLSVGLIGCGIPTGPVISLPTTEVSQSVIVDSFPSTCTYRGKPPELLPDPLCTPGSTDPGVTQENIQQTICKSGYTASIRPPTSYTSPLKLHMMQAYGVSRQPAADFEFDHLVSLELGGSPKDVRNLWPEPDRSPNKKDRLENTLNKLVCRGTISLSDAQAAIMSNWIVAYKLYIGPK